MLNDKGEEVELRDSYDTESLPELEKIIANDTEKSASADEYLEEGSGFMEESSEDDDSEGPFIESSPASEDLFENDFVDFSGEE